MWKVVNVTDPSRPRFWRNTSETPTAESIGAIIACPVVLIEEDSDHPAHYDVFDMQGRIFTVEPVNA